jgi:hypothetical protein
MKTVKTALLYIICLVPLTVFVSFISCNKSYVMDVHAGMQHQKKQPAPIVQKEKSNSIQLVVNH